MKTTLSLICLLSGWTVVLIFLCSILKRKLAQIEERVGPYMFSCLYLNKPIDASKRKFQKDWLVWVDKKEVPEVGYTSIAVDPAISEKDDACETAITQVFHHIDESKRPHMYWMRDMHGHYNPFETGNQHAWMAEQVLGRSIS